MPKETRTGCRLVCVIICLTVHVCQVLKEKQQLASARKKVSSCIRKFTVLSVNFFKAIQQTTNNHIPFFVGAVMLWYFLATSNRCCRLW